MIKVIDLSITYLLPFFNPGLTYIFKNGYIYAEANSLLAISKYKCSSLVRF